MSSGNSCLLCGDEFFPLHNEKFCRNCISKVYTKCPQCGKLFYPKTGARDKKFCSPECKIKYYNNARPHAQPGEKICATCGKKFTSKTAAKKYCSPECYPSHIHHKEYYSPAIPQKICPVCGKEFQAAYHRKYCSIECAKAADRQKKLAKYYAKKAQKIEVKNVKPVKRGSCIPAQKTFLKCPHCGKDFQKLHNSQKYCSAACRNAEKYQPVKKVKIVKKCENCGKEFQADHNGQKYCSELCRRLFNGLYKPDLKKCSYCGKTFQPKRKDQLYCSDECRIATRDEKVKQLTARDRKGESKMDRYIREAAECGMSYGKYRQAVEVQGRTYKQLRAEFLEYQNATNNAPPAFIYGGI